MLFLAALMYWLLCMRFRVQIDVSYTQWHGRVVFSVGVFRLNWRHEAMIARKKEGAGLCLMPLHGEKKREKKHAAQQMMQRMLLGYLRSIVRKREFAFLSLHVCVGLGDACETAVAAGAIRAFAAALFAASARPQAWELRVTPEFSRACLSAYGRGIFFCQPGDIILAALKATKRKKKEGLKWTSIPLKA